MRSSGGDARIIETPKNTKIIIGRWATKEEIMWGKVPTSMTGTNVDEERGGGEGVRPKLERDISMEEKSAHTSIDGAKDSFGATILLRGIRGSETKNRAMCGKEGANPDAVELLPVVSLQGMNGTPKLRSDIGVKGSEKGECIGFSPQWEVPHIVRKIMKYNKIV